MSYERTLFQLLKRLEHELNTAIIYNEEELTYRQLAREAELIAANLMQSCGIVQGDRIAILLPNRPEFVSSFFAVSLLGGIAVPIGTRVGEMELEYILSHSEARVVITIADYENNDYSQVVQNMRSKLSNLEHIFSIGASKSTSIRNFSELRQQCDMNLFRKHFENYQKEASSKDVCLILYTSGTTGAPKGVMLSTNNIISTVDRINQKVKAAMDDRYLVVVPMTSSLGCVTSMLRALRSGSALVLMEKFKAVEVLREIERRKVTVHVGVPTMFILELMEIEKENSKYDLSSVRQAFVSGSECPEDVMSRIEKEMGCQVIIGYGLTETTSYITVTNPDDPFRVRISTVGSPIPGEEISIVKEVESMGNNDSGEIVVRGESVMVGYFKDPEKTSEDIDRDGWLHTGDIGCFDQEGNLVFKGRKKEMIIRGGYNIYPAEIENLLLRHDKVGQVAVIGIPDSVLGERSVVCVVPSPGSSISKDEVIDYCKQSLTDYKIPDLVYIFQSFPMTHNSKVKKTQLREDILKDVVLR
ncbi:MAG TPA: class I adenylate-forming enzyme family protein [Desulfobacteraceae bacterium]|nr:class I adenylate-forming enzyme family protein [Desulfobacteraceae bacterium]HPJ66822.1 class I adenylate-forming enzyme family protein [Desulfobacteraceae bacterium]HPQ27032.1 class I adenylate-forming enzyme family protein [Desulfobacteraceae bacterium]